MYGCNHFYTLIVFVATEDSNSRIRWIKIFYPRVYVLSVFHFVARAWFFWFGPWVTDATRRFGTVAVILFRRCNRPTRDCVLRRTRCSLCVGGLILPPTSLFGTVQLGKTYSLLRAWCLLMLLFLVAGRCWCVRKPVLVSKMGEVQAVVPLVQSGRH